MAFCSNTGKLSEIPFTSSSPSLGNLSRSSFSFNTLAQLFISNSNSKPPFPTLIFSSLRTTHHSSPKPNPNTAPWLAKPSTPKRVSTEDPSHRQQDRPQNAVERIVLRLRNLGLTPEEEEEQQQVKVSALTVTGEEKLSDLLRREWVRPDAMLLGDDDDEVMLLPWKRVEEEEERVGVEEGFKKRTVKAPSLAELTLEDELLRRLRREGMRVRERVSVPKAGLTQEVMDKIHERWRKEELVRLKFHEELAKNMRLAHQLVEVSFLPIHCFAML